MTIITQNGDLINYDNCIGIERQGNELRAVTSNYYDAVQGCNKTAWIIIGKYRNEDDVKLDMRIIRKCIENGEKIVDLRP